MTSHDTLHDGTAFQDHYPPDVAACFGCGRLNEHGHHLRTTWDGEGTVTRFTPGPEQTAVPGYVYGGLIASVIDCAGTGTAAGAAYRAAGRTMGDPDDHEPPLRFVTGRLEVDYLAPTPLGVELVVRGHIDEIKARKVVVSLEMAAGDTVVARGRVIAVLMPATME
ncbi:acyl-coenzyme A thioesterase PaaI-like protein [Kineosphaera limosa]|nr:hotdog domain-containing protein [Kineosphaera limosa]NYE00111.1 acyl-coenzyme A thioesterase PaaI-like protein [Kineosphaera limosa]